VNDLILSAGEDCKYKVCVLASFPAAVIQNPDRSSFKREVVCCLPVAGFSPSLQGSQGRGWKQSWQQARAEG
jgi:hypothetical protein